MPYTHPIAHAWQKFLDDEADGRVPLPFEFYDAKLYFTARVVHALELYPITSIAHLLSFTPRKLLMLPQFGKKSLREVESMLARHGLSLRKE